MPSSITAGKQTIVKWFAKQKDIETIIDVGPGIGTYASLLGPKYRFIGIEIFAPYVNQFDLLRLYDKVIISDIRYCKLPKADCIIFGDILEHLEKKDAIKVLKEAEIKYKHIVVSIPIEMEQDSYEGNEYEKHLSVWTEKELRELFSGFPIKKKEAFIMIFIR